MKLYGLMLLLSMTYADRVFHVESSVGLCKLNYRGAHAECKRHGGHLATEAEIKASDTSSCPTCGWTLDRTSVCPTKPANVRCEPCTQRGGGQYDAWCYAGGPVGNCSSGLGLELNNNDLYQLRASSEKNDWWRIGRQRWSASIARLHAEGDVNAWMPTRNQEGEYLEVKFNDLTAVTGLVTQGASRLLKKTWVKKYKVKYNDYGSDFQFITENGEIKVFDGNVNNNGLKRNMFPEPVLARSIRIFPVTYNSGIAMRIEVLGCEMEVYNNV